ncbi:MAG: hypothetical protein K0U29_08815 [Gammaproteobacteria bacterium]|nr:hypothetical protein [Gammaproteobacteria bacterium]MCH9745014.1 hypothetical protein [Gammaproteobacteria bacterium]
MKIFRTTVLASIAFFVLVVSNIACAEINRVRVINNSKQTIYIHKGGYASSEKILAGKWKIFYYPFKVVPPGSNKESSSSLLVATAGGKWVTSPEGYTQLKKPSMTLCLDYRSAQHRKKTGNRLWTIKRVGGFDKNCKVKGYKQPWYQGSKD